MEAREGDLIETWDRLIFDVKGLIHPRDKVIAFPRFVPDPQGKRKRKGINYRKVYVISKRYRLLEDLLPHYLVFDPVLGERICEVPTKDVRQQYNPVDRLRELRNSGALDRLETDALRLAETLRHHSGVRWKKLGISGSLLAHLHTPKSDIDAIVYGEKDGLRVHKALKSLLRNGKGRKDPLRPYTRRQLETLHHFRSRDTDVPFNEFFATEHRKVLQGRFQQNDFYIRCVKDWNEAEECYGDVVYKRVGYSRIRAVISDDLQSIFTPCRYSLSEVKALDGKCGEAVTEIVSFRGRFCEQAQEGEAVIAQGKIEEVRSKEGLVAFRLLLGTHTSDFMVLER